VTERSKRASTLSWLDHVAPRRTPRDRKTVKIGPLSVEISDVERHRVKRVRVSKILDKARRACWLDLNMELWDGFERAQAVMIDLIDEDSAPPGATRQALERRHDVLKPDNDTQPRKSRSKSSSRSF